MRLSEQPEILRNTVQKPLVYKRRVDRSPRRTHVGTVTRDEDSTEPTARLEFVDVATGEPVCPAPPERTTSDGTAPSGRIVVDLGGVAVEVDPEDVLTHDGKHPRRRRYRVDLDSPADYRGRAEAKAALRATTQAGTSKKRPRLFRETFDNAKAAAHEFYKSNENFFDHVRDPFDGLREWMDGVEVQLGKRARRLSQTPAGRRILEEPLAERAITLALAYVFGRARGRRWDAVDWHLVDLLGESLEPYFEDPGDATPSRRGLYWRPIVGTITAEQLDDLSPEARAQISEWEGSEEVRRALADLRDAYAQNQACIPPELHAIVERRIAEWDRWTGDPSQIPEYACEPDERSGGYTCNYPAVAGELREIERACRRPYDPDWALPEARQGTPGFPDVSAGPEDSWSAQEEPPFPADPPSEDSPMDLTAELGTELEAHKPPPDDTDHLPEPDFSVDLEAPSPISERSSPAIAERLRLLTDDGRAFGGPSDAVLRRRVTDGVVYQLELRQCGKKNRRTGVPWCTCMRHFPERGHGPYWYAYFVDRSGTRRSKYLGKTFRRL